MVEQAEVAVKGFGWVQELCGGSGREEGCGDLAGDEAALADAGEDYAMAALGSCSEQFGNLLEYLGLRAFEALGKLFECLGLDADEVSGAVRGWGLGKLGHCGWRDIG